MKIAKRYTQRLWQVWRFWSLPTVLGVVSLIFGPGFSVPRWAGWIILGIGFLLANIKIFAEQEKRIHEFNTSKKVALDAVILEIESNKMRAEKNSREGSSSFTELLSDQCQEHLLNRKSKLNDKLSEAAKKYKDLVETVNNRIAGAQAATKHGKSISEYTVKICKICKRDLPAAMSDLQKLIEQEIADSQADEN